MLYIIENSWYFKQKRIIINYYLKKIIISNYIISTYLNNMIPVTFNEHLMLNYVAALLYRHKVLVDLFIILCIFF